MIQLNGTTIWKDFSQYISKYMALKSDRLNILNSVYIAPTELSLGIECEQLCEDIDYYFKMYERSP